MGHTEMQQIASVRFAADEVVSAMLAHVSPYMSMTHVYVRGCHSMLGQTAKLTLWNVVLHLKGGHGGRPCCRQVKGWRSELMLSHPVSHFLLLSASYVHFSNLPCWVWGRHEHTSLQVHLLASPWPLIILVHDSCSRHQGSSLLHFPETLAG